MREINILQNSSCGDRHTALQKPAKTIPGSLLNEKGPCVAQDPFF